MRQSQRHYTIGQYFLTEAMSEIKHEYFDGEIFAMAGGSRDHDTIAGNVFAIFHAALRGSTCRAFTSDMRMRTPSGLYTYPDVSIVCGTPDIIQVQGTDTVGNPVVLVEVLSESTCDYDRGQKFEQYRTIPTLRDYLLIEQALVSVECRRRGADDVWVSETITAMNQSIRLNGVEIELPLDRVYERVELAG